MEWTSGLNCKSNTSGINRKRHSWPRLWQRHQVAVAKCDATWLARVSVRHMRFAKPAMFLVILYHIVNRGITKEGMNHLLSWKMESYWINPHFLEFLKSSTYNSKIQTYNRLSMFKEEHLITRVSRFTYFYMWKNSQHSQHLMYLNILNWIWT